MEQIPSDYNTLAEKVEGAINGKTIGRLERMISVRGSIEASYRIGYLSKTERHQLLMMLGGHLPTAA